MKEMAAMVEEEVEEEEDKEVEEEMDDFADRVLILCR